MSAHLWSRFSAAVITAGLQPRDCKRGHWRIEGGQCEINWYPFSKERTIYVNGTTNKATIKNGTVERAIAAALNIGRLEMVAAADKVKRKNMAKVKRRMMSHDPHCHWCRAKLVSSDATVDHVVPIARGGANTKDNLVLACRTCNQKRGHC